MPNNLAKLQRLLETFDTEALTKQEFINAFQNVLKIVAITGENHAKAVAKIEETYGKLLDSMGKKHDELRAALKAEVDKLFVGKHLEQMKAEHQAKMTALDEKLKTIKNGRDGNPGPRGPQGLDGALMRPEEIIGKINQSEELINPEQVKGLEGLVNDLVRKKLAGMKLGGGYNYGRLATRFISEAPSGTPNGSLKTFYLSAIPAPASLLLTVNGQPQRPGSSNEYTNSDKTITFTDANKPKTGDLLWAYYTKF